MVGGSPQRFEDRALPALADATTADGALQFAGHALQIPNPGLDIVQVFARQPVWLEAGARRVWARVRAATQSLGLVAPLGLGAAWALLPCGLLYSALMVAALAGDAVGGAAVMALFALGSGLWLWLGPWLLLRLGQSARGAWGMRVAGLALAATSAWGLWMGLVHDQAPWCVVPAP